MGACNRTCQGCNPRYDDASFDVVTNSLSVDYMTSPLELFGEIHRVPAGLFHGGRPRWPQRHILGPPPTLQAHPASLRAERRACSPRSAA